MYLLFDRRSHICLAELQENPLSDTLELKQTPSAPVYPSVRRWFEGLSRRMVDHVMTIRDLDDTNTKRFSVVAVPILSPQGRTELLLAAERSPFRLMFIQPHAVPYWRAMAQWSLEPREKALFLSTVNALSGSDLVQWEEVWNTLKASVRVTV